MENGKAHICHMTEVDSGQLCHVLLTKPLHLPALWQ
jgi:hypothetical protein